MDANYFEKLEQIVDKLMEKHIPLSAKNVEESKEILALCQYYKISRALAKQSKQPCNCNLPNVSNLVCPTHGTMLYKHPNGLAYCSLCNYSVSWQTGC